MCKRDSDRKTHRDRQTLDKRREMGVEKGDEKKANSYILK